MDIMNSLMCGGEPYASPTEAWDDDFDPEEEVIRELRRSARETADEALIKAYDDAMDVDDGDMLLSVIYGDELGRRCGPVDYTLPLMEDPSQPGYHRLPVKERQWDDELPF